jgi:dipeptidyl aminopeptidase/acylaminoacyl peptidase
MRNPADAKMILSRTGAWSALEWSPDDKRLLLSNYISRTASFLYVFDMTNGALTPIHDTLDTVSQEAGAWDSKGEGLFLTSDEFTDFRSLLYHDLKSGKEVNLTADISWDIRDIILSNDRKNVVFSTNEHGYSSIYKMDAQTFVYKKITSLPSGIIGSFHFKPTGNILGFTIQKPNRPADVYTIDLNTTKIEQWTQSECGELDTSTLKTPEIIHFPTFDSSNGETRLIPCFYYKPEGNGPFPVLISIHGGPETQYWPSFSPITQFYVNELGIAVLAPNVRGSGGYGKTYLSLDNGFKREDAVKDIGALLTWIGKQPELDSEKIAVFGGSYGGYMSLASMIRYSTQIKAGIDLYGISNYITFLQKTAPYRRDLRRAEYGDERDPVMAAFLERISPLHAASGITCPLLIIQGANDPRVPAQESQQIADAVKKNGGTVWFLMPDDEGHGFRKKVNRDYQEGVIALFLKQFLL